jgi:hypothetical protein
VSRSSAFRKVIFLFSVLIIAFLAFAGFKLLSARQSSSARVDPDAGPAFMGPAGSVLQVTPGAPDFSISKAQAGPSVRPASFDKDLRSLPETGPAEKRPIPEIESPFRVKGVPSNAPDAVAQTSTGTLSMPGPSSSFKGLDLQNWGAGWPPDTNGDVGPTYYIQTVNTSIGVFDKSGSRVAAFTFDTFFGGTGTPCDASNQGDPVVLYDAQSGRWIITDFAWTNFTSGPYYECIAVSKTGDPVSGGWWMYGFRADDTSRPYLNDYPKLGVWSDGIYMSANMFDILNPRGAASYKGVRVWALNRDDLVSGAPLNSVIFDLGASYFSLAPSNYRGAQPPTGTPAFFASVSSSTTNMMLWKFHVDWANPNASTLSGPTNVPIASFSQPSGQVPQLGSSETLDTLGDRLMVQLQYRDFNGVESLWATHSVASGGVTGIRWYEIRNLSGTPSVYQQSTYQPDSLYRWMGSLAVDGQGNMAVGYSVSSASLYPGIRYAGRQVGDPLNTLGQAETTLIAGSGSQSGGYNRWGDYSAMTVDPVDDCTFWYTTEYYETIGNNWQTRIGSFQFPDCGGSVPSPTPAPTATNTPVPSPTPTSVAGSMHVGDLDASSAAFNKARWQATVSILVHDADHNPLAGVTVSGSWSGGTNGTSSCVTDASGLCAVDSSNISNKSSSVTFSVDSLTASGYAYVATANHDPDGDSNGNSIAITWP